MRINFLEKIKTSIENRVELIPDIPTGQTNTIDFLYIFRSRQKPVIISEIKFAGPSRGQIYCGKLNPVDIASQYLSSGTAALSVLTEP